MCCPKPETPTKLDPKASRLNLRRKFGRPVKQWLYEGECSCGDGFVEV